MSFDKRRAKALLESLPVVRQIFELRRARWELSQLAAERDRFKTAFAPGHFYSPIPDLRELHRRESRLFGRSEEAIPGIDLNLTRQRELLHELARFYPDLPFARGKQPGLRYFYDNPYFGYADAIILYCMIRHLRPKRIVEIGCGFSSCVTLDTNERSFSNSIQCVFIDPFPQSLQALLKAEDHSRIEIIQDYVQDVPRRHFDQLERDDILFVDSSHVLKTGGDLNHILFQLLPRLRAGVHVHFHDVPFPFEYPKEWVFGGRAWNECYALRAFLQYNDAFEIVYFNSSILRDQRAFLKQNMPLCLENEGGSLWLRKRKEESFTEPLAEPRSYFNPGHKFDAVALEHPRQLGKGWSELAQDLSGRWTGLHAEVVFRAPEQRGKRLVLRGLQPNPAGVTLTISAEGAAFAKIALAEGPFVVTQDLPESLVGRGLFVLGLQLEKPSPDNGRALGLLFGTIEIVD